MPVTAINSGQTIAASPRITGSVMYAPVGTPLPTTSFAAVNAGFTDLGFIDETGLKQKESRTNTDVFGWGGGLIGTVQEKYVRDLNFKLYQLLNPNVLATAFGHNNITVSGPTSMNGTEIAVAMNPQLLDTLSWVFDGSYFTAAGYQALVRIVVPVARVVSIGDVDITSKTFTSIDCSMKAFADTNGNYSYGYFNDGITTGQHVGGS
jgi:hypothetical protein